MNEQDKVFARQALEQNRLTIEQVAVIRAEVERSGRSFQAVAMEQGFLKSDPPKAAPPPPKPVPPEAPTPAQVAAPAPIQRRIPAVYLALLVASFLIFSGLLVATLLKMREQSRHDDDLAIESLRSRAEADRRASEAARGYTRAVVSGNEAVARGHLTKARDAMAKVEKILLSGQLPPELSALLNDAFVAYNMYLTEMPDDVDVRIERARTHELRRNYDLAVADLERAVELRRDLEPALRQRIDTLRRLVARKPQ